MRRGLLVCLIALALPAAARATPGDLDPTFSRDGFIRFGFGDDQSVATAIALDSQGGAVIAGTTGPVGDDGDAPAALAVARLTPDGKLDKSFSGDGRAKFDIGASPQVGNVALGAGGLIVVGASAGGDLVALRLLSDGSPDSSFAGDGIASADAGGTETGGSLLVGDDGTVTVGGSACFVHTCEFALARFAAAGGGLDPSFDGDGIVVTPFPGDYAVLNDLARTPGGGVLAAGDTLFQEAALAEYTPGGALDGAFNGGGQAVISENTQGARAVAVDLAGRILGLGKFGQLYRVTADGAIDPAFARTYVYGQAFTVDGHDRVVSAGELGGCYRGCTPVDTVLARTDAETGATDTTFGQSGFGHIALADLDAKPDGARAVTVDATDRPLTAGYSGDEMAVARFESEPGPPDRDGDGVVDSADRCPTIFSGRRDGCPRAKRKLTLHRHKRADLWTGRIKSDQDRCNAGQTVRVFRKRRGKDENTVSATSDEDGKWSADGNLRRGTYYARVERRFKPRWGTCVKARSNAITIRR
jgi:uncharacterized delta-60 repeat protein